MRPQTVTTIVQRGAAALVLSILTTSGVAAQAASRLVLPAGTVILVRTEQPLESNAAQVGQTFETAVVEAVGIEGFAAIPEGSRIRGVVKFVQPATRQRSGVIEIDFDRLALGGGTSFTIDGKLTSTNAAERRQIESSADQRVVLVGGRGGVGAAIAGAGSEDNPASSILSVISGMLSEGRDVRVPAGTQLAVQLQQPLVLSGRGGRRADAATIYTATERIRAAQQELARQNYYRGAVNGVLDNATQRALFEFQVDKGIVATGNLDARTAQALGISITHGGTGTAGGLSAADASLVRRAAQNLAGRLRDELRITAAGRVDARRNYDERELDLWFALSAFADNASLYEQIVRSSGNTGGALVAGRALASAARRVDEGFARTRTTAEVRNGWVALRRQLAPIDPGFAR